MRRTIRVRFVTQTRVDIPLGSNQALVTGYFEIIISKLIKRVAYFNEREIINISRVQL